MQWLGFSASGAKPGFVGQKSTTHLGSSLGSRAQDQGNETFSPGWPKKSDKLVNAPRKMLWHGDFLVKSVVICWVSWGFREQKVCHWNWYMLSVENPNITSDLCRKMWSRQQRKSFERSWVRDFPKRHTFAAALNPDSNGCVQEEEKKHQENQNRQLSYWPLPATGQMRSETSQIDRHPNGSNRNGTWLLATFLIMGWSTLWSQLLIFNQLSMGQPKEQPKPQGDAPEEDALLGLTHVLNMVAPRPSAATSGTSKLQGLQAGLVAPTCLFHNGPQKQIKFNKKFWFVMFLPKKISGISTCCLASKMSLFQAPSVAAELLVSSALRMLWPADTWGDAKRLVVELSCCNSCFIFSTCYLHFKILKMDAFHEVS